MYLSIREVELLADEREKVAGTVDATLVRASSPTPVCA